VSDFLTSATLAERWGCNPNAVIKLAKIGALPYVSIGKLLRFKLADVLEYEKSDNAAFEKEENDVYVIRCNEYVKIGKAADTTRRIAALQASNPYPLEVIAIITDGNGHALERELHSRFAGCRHRGEWFRVEGEIEAWISTGCE
jgi:hypothetical protein